MISKKCNSFGNDIEGKSVIAGEAWQSHKNGKCISILSSFHSKRLPRFARNDAQKEYPNY